MGWRRTMPSLGEQLRAQRERKGITLEQAAADTRIREKFLKALEEGDYPALPGAVYTRGLDRKSTRLNSSHTVISYAVFCLKKKKKNKTQNTSRLAQKPL